MRALDKLKQIESEIYPAIAGEPLPNRWRGNSFLPQSALYNKDMEFIFKAFRVMQEIATEYKKQAGHKVGHETEGITVDKEFEISMTMDSEKKAADERLQD